VLRIGLTGGIGSGKSTVARLLEAHGARVVDADAVAREVMEPGQPTLAAVAGRFGAHLLRADGTLDRAGLAAVVFPDPDALAALDAITGPAVTRRVAVLRRQVPRDRVSVFDMPLLVERRLWVHEHLTVVVGAGTETRVRRLVDQRGLAEADARHRVAAQASDEQRQAAADVWLDNDGEREETLRAVARLWEQRLAPYEANLLGRRRNRQPETGPVLRPPDPTWPAQAARLVARLQDALGDLAPRVDHMGSTSVPGLPAVDVVDLQVGVRSLDVADGAAFRAAMDDRGFFRVEDNLTDTPHGPGETWPERFHGSADPGRVSNIHVREVGSPAWRFALQFRDWLRADAVARDDYAALESRLAGRAGTTSTDVEAKEPWFAAAFPRMHDWVLRAGWTG